MAGAAIRGGHRRGRGAAEGRSGGRDPGEVGVVVGGAGEVVDGQRLGGGGGQIARRAQEAGRMRAGMDRTELTDRDVRVDLGRGEALMTQQGLDVADVGSPLEHQRRCRVANHIITLLINAVRHGSSFSFVHLVGRMSGLHPPGAHASSPFLHSDTRKDLQ